MRDERTNKQLKIELLSQWKLEAESRKISQIMAILSHKRLMLWRKKHIFINISWHGGYGPLLSLFEDLEVLILHKSPIV